MLHVAEAAEAGTTFFSSLCVKLRALAAHFSWLDLSPAEAKQVRREMWT
jgi:hypothetical protein